MGAEPRFEPWPLGVALLLLGMMAVCLGFLAVAVTHPDGEVVDDAWQAGLRIDEVRDEQRRAEALGVELSLVAQAEGEELGVRVSLRDASGAPLRAEAVVVRRERPAEGGFDADFVLDREGSGFVGRVPLPRPGRWRLEAQADLGELTLRRRYDWWSD